MDDLIDLWRTHSAVDLYLLLHVPDDGLDAAPASGGDTVGQMFAHMNDLRLRWMADTAPDLCAALTWFERQPERPIDREQLERALRESAAAVEALVTRQAGAGEGVNGFPGPLTTFVGYLVAHEAYHWGEIGLALTQAGQPLDRDAALGLWSGWWGREAD